MVSSNLDMFRDFVFNSKFLESYEIGPEVIEKIREDELELLKFSLKWLRFTMFGEGDFKVREDAKSQARERLLAAKEASLKERREREESLLSKTPEEALKEADGEE